MEPAQSLNIAERFLDARIAEGDGDRVALKTTGGDFTYAQVHDLASRYATVLRDRGVRQEQRVIIALPDGADFVGAFFGTLKLGAVVVMVNPHQPADAIFDVCDRARAQVCVLSAGTLPHGDTPWPARWLEVGHPADDEALAGASPMTQTVPTHRDDPAIWLFSGGTTGRPKAVVQSHASFAYTTARYGHEVLGYDRDDVVLSVPKLYFGYATGANLLFPFSVGATSVLFSERCTVDTLFAMIERFSPTILINVPTMVNHMVNAPEAPDMASLRLSTSAGEALSPTLHGRWRERFGVPLVDGLGTAEMWHIFLSNRPDKVQPGTLGWPVPGFEIELRDPEGRPVSQGEVGRMWVKGGARAIGYWQNAEADREAFVGPWYASQDMLCQNADGSFTYCGRGDDMLKVSGRWVSPREVEDSLLRHPMVKEAAVVGVADAAGLVKPWAFILPAEGLPAHEAEAAKALQDHVKSDLEPYKYPRQVRFMADLPRTHLGKVSRGALKKMAHG
ncbi:MAG: benzoate-CoA ligase family protein [Bradymonadia bacterium]